MDLMLDEVENGSNTEKHLVVIAKTPDNASSIISNVDEIIDKASAMGVRRVTNHRFGFWR